VKRWYLDANANYGLLDYVKEALLNCPTVGNPNSLHYFGQTVKAEVEETREILREVVGAKDEDYVLFCSGATEAANWLAHCVKQRGLAVEVCAADHACVRESFVGYEAVNFFSVDYLASDPSEFVLDYLRKRSFNALFLIHAHNETGVIFDIEKIARELKQSAPEVLIVSDFVQSFCKLNLTPFKESFVDAIFISGHKVGALPGVGALIAKKSFPISPLIRGGSQERYLRGGTENYTAIISLKHAMQYWRRLGIDAVNTKYWQIKNFFLEELRSTLDAKSIKFEFLFEKWPTIGNTIYVVFPGAKSSDFLIKLDLLGVCASAGSACYSGKPLSPSLEGFSVSKELAQGSLRLSFRFDFDVQEIPEICKIMSKVFEK